MSRFGSDAPVCKKCARSGRGVLFSLSSKRGFGNYFGPCEQLMDRAGQQPMRTTPATGLEENYSEHGAGAAYEVHSDDNPREMQRRRK